MGPQQLTKGGGRENFTWGKAQQKSFDDMKHCLFSAPILSLPDLQQPFDIETDACDYVVGAILPQHNHPIEYHSETLSDTVHKYPTYDKVMYSIVQDFCQWKHYIMGKETIIHTDHKPLQFIQTQGKLQNDHHKNGPHTCNYSISTSSIIQGAKSMLLTSSVDLSWLHSPLCSILVGMRHLSGPNFINEILISPPLINSWLHVRISIISTFRMEWYAIWAIYVFLQVSVQR
jgi:hypothetical protein